jgi:hypothetical protein
MQTATLSPSSGALPVGSTYTATYTYGASPSGKTITVYIIHKPSKQKMFSNTSVIVEGTPILVKTWTQTDWANHRTYPTLQVGTWLINYDNYYTGDNENENTAGELKLALSPSTIPGWWDNHWTCRRPITIMPGSNPDNYQLKIVIPRDSDMQGDYRDLRFTENEGGLQTLSYWVENYTPDNVTVWVRRMENYGIKTEDPSLTRGLLVHPFYGRIQGA